MLWVFVSAISFGFWQNSIAAGFFMLAVSWIYCEVNLNGK